MKRLIILVFVVSLLSGYAVIEAADQYVWNDISPIMSANGCAGCHSFAASYDALMAKKSTSTQTRDLAMVTPAKPDSSVIVWRIEGELPDGTAIGRMPQGGPKLPDATIDTIRDWITQGANNEAVDVDDAKRWGEVKAMFR